MTTSPAANLATHLGGTVTGPSTISVGTHTVCCYPTGVVYVLPERQRIGTWSEPTEVLAERYLAAVGKRVAS